MRSLTKYLLLLMFHVCHNYIFLLICNVTFIWQTMHLLAQNRLLLVDKLDCQRIQLVVLTAYIIALSFISLILQKYILTVIMKIKLLTVHFIASLVRIEAITAFGSCGVRHQMSCTHKANCRLFRLSRSMGKHVCIIQSDHTCCF